MKTEASWYAGCMCLLWIFWISSRINFGRSEMSTQKGKQASSPSSLPLFFSISFSSFSSFSSSLQTRRHRRGINLATRIDSIDLLRSFGKCYIQSNDSLYKLMPS